MSAHKNTHKYTTTTAKDNHKTNTTPKRVNTTAQTNPHYINTASFQRAVQSSYGAVDMGSNASIPGRNGGQFCSNASRFEGDGTTVLSQFSGLGQVGANSRTSMIDRSCSDFGSSRILQIDRSSFDFVSSRTSPMDRPNTDFRSSRASQIERHSSDFRSSRISRIERPGSDFGISHTERPSSDFGISRLERPGSDFAISHTERPSSDFGILHSERASSEFGLPHTERPSSDFGSNFALLEKSRDDATRRLSRSFPSSSAIFGREDRRSLGCDGSSSDGLSYSPFSSVFTPIPMIDAGFNRYNYLDDRTALSYHQTKQLHSRSCSNTPSGESLGEYLQYEASAYRERYRIPPLVRVRSAPTPDYSPNSYKKSKKLSGGNLNAFPSVSFSQLPRQFHSKYSQHFPSYFSSEFLAPSPRLRSCSSPVPINLPRVFSGENDAFGYGGENAFSYGAECRFSGENAFGYGEQHPLSKFPNGRNSTPPTRTISDEFFTPQIAKSWTPGRPYTPLV